MLTPIDSRSPPGDVVELQYGDVGRRRQKPAGILEVTAVVNGRCSTTSYLGGTTFLTSSASALAGMADHAVWTQLSLSRSREITRQPPFTIAPFATTLQSW